MKKILIIGSKCFNMSTEDWRIDSFAWDEINEIGNPYDYHTLIIDLLGICDDSARNSIEWNELQSKLTVSNTWNFLKYKYQIIVVGDPRFDVLLEKSEKRPFLWWTGFEFEWDDLPGDTIYPSSDNPIPEEYTQRLCSYSYSLKDVQIYPEHLACANLYLKEKKIHLQKKVFLKNQMRLALAFSVFLRMPGKFPGREYYYRYTGPILLLPRIDADEEETLEIVLRDICEIEILTREPVWVEQLVAPRQRGIDQKISRYRKAVRKVKLALQKEEDKRIEARQYLKLLHVGDTELERIVWDVLDELGGNVERPKSMGKGDGWIYPQIGNKKCSGVLEIKSTGNEQFGEGGIGQLAKWKHLAIELRDKEHKGIFIGNSCRKKSPDQRPCPFAVDWCKTAKTSRICALTTADLYRLYELKYQGKFEANTFWTYVFQTNGILNIAKYLSDAVHPQE